MASAIPPITGVCFPPSLPAGLGDQPTGFAPDMNMELSGSISASMANLSLIDAPPGSRA